jgi:DNA-binding response OmpR family regulator
MSSLVEWEPLQSETVAITPAKFEARVTGKLLELTRSEFIVLYTLMHNPGQVFSTSQLLNAVFGEPTVRVDTLIPSHICRIRAKIGKISAGLSRVVKTIPGVGYTFAEPLLNKEEKGA